MDVGCIGTIVPIDWVEVLEVLRIVYLSVGLKCWKFCACWSHRYLCACLSVGLNCWKFCWDSCADTLCVSAIFPSVLDAQVLVCLSVG